MALVTVSERVATQPRLLVVTVEPQLTDRLDFTAFVETPWGVLIEVHQRIPCVEEKPDADAARFLATTASPNEGNTPRC